MQIICHRGIWNTDKEKNSWVALKRAIDMGLGFETDIRDFNGKLYISHDPIKLFSQKLSLRKLFKYCQKHGYKGKMALNIKSDGIIEQCTKLLKQYKLSNFFFFDMSIPELYKNRDNNVYVGVSELSDGIVGIDAKGCWLDSFFNEDRINRDTLDKLTSKFKDIVIVSSELHRREYSNFWKMLKKSNLNDNYYLCTDKPEEAIKFFDLHI